MLLSLTLCSLFLYSVSDIHKRCTSCPRCTDARSPFPSLSPSREQVICLLVRCEEAARHLKNVKPDHLSVGVIPIWKFVTLLYCLVSTCLNHLRDKFPPPPYDGPFWLNLGHLLTSVEITFNKTTLHLKGLPSSPDTERQLFEVRIEAEFQTQMRTCWDIVDRLSLQTPWTNDWGLWCGNKQCDNLSGPSEMRLKTLACGGRCGVRYCSRACQEAGWRAGHKAVCRPARVGANATTASFIFLED